MASLMFVFYILVVISGIVGGGRGWAKELLVTFAILVGLALISAFESWIPFTSAFIKVGSEVQFWFRTLIIFAMAVFGYESPRMSKFAPASGKRDQIQETLLGVVLGMINGYLIAGSLWGFMHQANYPLQPYIISPENDPSLGLAASEMVRWLPTETFIGQAPGVYIIVILSIVFVLVVFL